jgi:hypothetical protein
MSPAHIRIRRPSYEPAWPQSNPGGTDYKSQPSPPSANLDCEGIESLLSGVKVSEFRSCLESLKGDKDEFKVIYLLMRETQPRLVLQVDKNTPDCLAESVPTLPVPREFFFQTIPYYQPGQQYSKEVIKERSDTGPYYECYATGIDIHADEFLGEKVPKAQWKLEIRFPILVPPPTDVEAKRLLLGWMVSPFFKKEKREWVIPSRVVPRTLCKECFGEDSLLKTGAPLPLLWPIPQTLLKQ